MDIIEYISPDFYLANDGNIVCPDLQKYDSIRSGFYRVILEPIIRNLVSDEASWFFPTKFVSKLTPEPDVLSIVKEKIQTADKASPDELTQFDNIIPEGVPIWQNVILTLIFLGLVAFFIHFIFQKRRLN